VLRTRHSCCLCAHLARIRPMDLPAQAGRTKLQATVRDRPFPPSRWTSRGGDESGSRSHPTPDTFPGTGTQHGELPAVRGLFCSVFPLCKNTHTHTAQAIILPGRGREDACKNLSEEGRPLVMGRGGGVRVLCHGLCEVPERICCVLNA
jgi:hypothetical protein